MNSVIYSGKIAGLQSRIPTMLDSPLMSLLEKSLDYSSTQQSALSANISNINTPGYVRKDASFASVLASASEPDQALDTPLPGITDQPGQLPINAAYASQGLSSSDDIPIVSDHSGAMRSDGNNIDIDTEMSKLAQNQIYYQALTQFESGQLSGLKYVIGGG
jgi:flagellar basal-body rod protein FlgB